MKTKFPRRESAEVAKITVLTLGNNLVALLLDLRTTTVEFYRVNWNEKGARKSCGFKNVRVVNCGVMTTKMKNKKIIVSNIFKTYLIIKHFPAFRRLLFIWNELLCQSIIGCAYLLATIWNSSRWIQKCLNKFKDNFRRQVIDHKNEEL